MTFYFLTLTGKKMNLDKHCLCPECKEPMKLNMPIWVTPGEESIDTSEVDWESGNHQVSTNWYCETCQDHHFPIDNELKQPEPEPEHILGELLIPHFCGEDFYEACDLPLSQKVIWRIAQLTMAKWEFEKTDRRKLVFKRGTEKCWLWIGTATLETL